MPFIGVTEEVDASKLCDSIHILARLNIAQAYKNGTTIAPAAEMTLSGLQDSEKEAFEPLINVYAIRHQHIIDKLDLTVGLHPQFDPVGFKIGDLVNLCAFLGAYQASKDMKAGIGMESAERVEDAGIAAYKAAVDAAERVVEDYHAVCCSHFSWEIESAERVLLAEDIERVEKMEDGVALVVKNSARHVVVDGDVSAVEYSRTLVAAAKWVLDDEDDEKNAGGGVSAKEGSGGSDPGVNPGTASESLYG